MQYPSTPSSSSTRVPTTPVPNAPYMSPKDLPPSPVTPTHALPGYSAPTGALQMYPMGYGAAPAAHANCTAISHLRPRSDCLLIFVGARSQMAS